MTDYDSVTETVIVPQRGTKWQGPSTGGKLNLEVTGVFVHWKNTDTGATGHTSFPEAFANGEGGVFTPASPGEFEEGHTYRFKDGATFRVYEVDDKRGYGVLISLGGNRMAADYWHSSFPKFVREDIS